MLEVGWVKLGGGGLRVGRPLGCRRLVDGAVGEGRGGKVAVAGVVVQKMFPGGGEGRLGRVTEAKDGLLG